MVRIIFFDLLQLKCVCETLVVCGTQFEFHGSALYNISGRGVSKGMVKWKIVKIWHIQKWKIFRLKEWCPGFYLKKKAFSVQNHTSEIAAQINAQHSCVLCANVALFWETSQRRRTLWLMSSDNHVGTLPDSETRLSNFVLNLIDQLKLTWNSGYMYAIRLNSCFSRV